MTDSVKEDPFLKGIREKTERDFGVSRDLAATQPKAPEDRIAEIRARLLAATQGPWQAKVHTNDLDEPEEWRIHYDDSGCWLATVHLGACAAPEEIAEGNATANMIAASPSDLLWLLTELTASQSRERALEEERDGLKEALAPFAAVADQYDDREDSGFEILADFDVLASRLILGHFRDARAALEGGKMLKPSVESLTAENKRLKEALELSHTIIERAALSGAWRKSYLRDTVLPKIRAALQQSQEKSS